MLPPWLWLMFYSERVLRQPPSKSCGLELLVLRRLQAPTLSFVWGRIRRLLLPGELLLHPCYSLSVLGLSASRCLQRQSFELNCPGSLEVVGWLFCGAL